MIRLWVDTDLALGTPAGDVDDGFALTAVVRAAQAGERSPGDGKRAELLGVSVVAGNAPADRALEAVQRLLRILGSEVPVVAQRDAPAALAALPDGASILALGPLGNLVAAAALNPAYPARASVRVVGTVRRAWRHPLLRLHDLNVTRDRAAARAFFALRFAARRVFPLDVVRALRVGRPELDAIAETGAAGEYLATHSRRWLHQAWWRHRSARFPLWDLVAAMDATDDLRGSAFAPGGVLESFDPRATLTRFLALLAPPG